MVCIFNDFYYFFRIRQNLDVSGFKLTEEEMGKIATIGDYLKEHDTSYYKGKGGGALFYIIF